MIGGSPCQNFSMADSFQNSNSYGLAGEKSRLFYEYARIKEEVQPTYFLLENVKMRKQAEEQLNKFLKINGLHINSSTMSIQNRDRIYWTNIKDSHDKKTFNSVVNNIPQEDIEKIINIPSNKWAIKELENTRKFYKNLGKETFRLGGIKKDFSTKHHLTNRDIVYILHCYLLESLVKKTPSRDKCGMMESLLNFLVKISHMSIRCAALRESKTDSLIAV